LRFFFEASSASAIIFRVVGPSTEIGFSMKTCNPFAMAPGEVHPAEGHGRGENHDVAGLQAVHGPLVGVEPEEPALGRHIELGGVDAADPTVGRALRAGRAGGPQRLVAVPEAVFEDIGHGHQLEPALLRRERVGGGPGAAAPAADEGDLDNVTAGGVDMGQDHAGQG
jgi:hypothetical protein